MCSNLQTAAMATTTVHIMHNGNQQVNDKGVDVVVVLNVVVLIMFNLSPSSSSHHCSYFSAASLFLTPCILWVVMVHNIEFGFAIC